MLRQSVIDSFRPETIEHVRRYINGLNVNNDGYTHFIPLVAPQAYRVYIMERRIADRERINGGSVEVRDAKWAASLKKLASKVEPKLKEIEAAQAKG